MAEVWSMQEIDLIIEDYLLMLIDELSGKPVNKSSHRAKLRPLLHNRSDGSIEFKHQNISAVLINLGLPFIKGYKPRWNFQHILVEKCTDLLARRREFYENKFIEFADVQEINSPVLDFNSIIDHPPGPKEVIAKPDTVNHKKPFKINYLEREQNNTALGLKGESLVMEYEKWRLSRIGLENFAEKVEWVAGYDDGAGFDILSRNENGSDRYIEVKTTRLGKETPIFFTNNEYNFSQKESTRYYLYRLFDFSKIVRLFEVNGSFDSFCKKEAVQYKGYFQTGGG